MSINTMEVGNTVLKADYEDEDYDEYEKYYERFHTPEFYAELDEAIAEAEYMRAHPETYKAYDSVKEMFRDMGFDVSGMPDD